MAKVTKVVSKANVLDLLSAVAGHGATFASFVYTNKEGETAKHRLVLGFDLHTLYKRDIEILRKLRPIIVRRVAQMIPGSALMLEACDAILASREKSLTQGIGNRDDYTNKDTYVFLKGVHGVKIHKETGDIHVTGLSQGKVIITPGTYKEVNSRPLTLAKAILEKRLPSAKYRQFKLGNVKEARLRGRVLMLA